MITGLKPSYDRFLSMPDFNYCERDSMYVYSRGVFISRRIVGYLTSFHRHKHFSFPFISALLQIYEI